MSISLSLKSYKLSFALNHNVLTYSSNMSVRRHGGVRYELPLTHGAQPLRVYKQTDRQDGDSAQ